MDPNDFSRASFAACWTSLGDKFNQSSREMPSTSSEANHALQHIATLSRNRAQ
jgi:hypothetical protein